MSAAFGRTSSGQVQAFDLLAWRFGYGITRPSCWRARYSAEVTSAAGIAAVRCRAAAPPALRCHRAMAATPGASGAWPHAAFPSVRTRHWSRTCCDWNEVCSTALSAIMAWKRKSRGAQRWRTAHAGSGRRASAGSSDIICDATALPFTERLCTEKTTTRQHASRLLRSRRGTRRTPPGCAACGAALRPMAGSEAPAARASPGRTCRHPLAQLRLPACCAPGPGHTTARSRLAPLLRPWAAETAREAPASRLHQDPRHGWSFGDARRTSQSNATASTMPATSMLRRRS